MYTVLYRTGTKDCFEWHTMISANWSEANKCRLKFDRTLVLSANEFEAKGLPKTFEADEYFAPAK